MKTIVFSNQKGGVAKTTSALNTAAALIRQGRRVLAVDLDPQGNLTFATGYNERITDVFNLLEAFTGEAEPEECMRHINGLDLFSIGLRATAADMMFTQVGREYLLKNILEEYQEDYDFCIIDTAPSLNILTVNALTAADYVIIPFTVDTFALQGMVQLQGFIENVQRYTNKDLKLLGMVRTVYDPHLKSTKVLKGAVNMARDSFHSEIITDIRKCADIGKAQISRQSIFDYSEKSRAAEDYMILAKRIMRLTEGGADDGKE